MGVNALLPAILFEMFLLPLLGKSMLTSCFVRANICFHVTFLLVFTLMGGYCVHLKWCLHSN